MKLSLTLQNGVANEDADDFVSEFNPIIAYTRTPDPASDDVYLTGLITGEQNEYDVPSIDITAKSFVPVEGEDQQIAEISAWYYLGNATTNPKENLAYYIRAILTRADVETTIDMYDISVTYQAVNNTIASTIKNYL